MIPADSPLLAPLVSDDPADFLLDSTVTFGFAGAGVTVDTREFIGRNINTIAWTEPQMDYLRQTFDYIETVTNLTFEEQQSGTLDIELLQLPGLDGETVGFADRIAPGQSMVVLLTDFLGPTAFGDDNTTVIHEIGHALGLDHPFEGPNAFPGVSDPFDLGDFALNTELATRMAYARGVSATYPELDIRGEAASFGALDIAALQLMYGANETTGLGDTTYGIDPGLITIWDNGGTDTIDFSAAQSRTVIDLRPATLEIEEGGGGFLSYVEQEGGALANGGYTIAFGVEIEHAIGGSTADLMIGNALANTFTGGRGNDTILGGDGLDTAVYSGDQSSYTLTLSADELALADRRDTSDDRDTLDNVEALVFGDNTGGPFNLGQLIGAQTLSQEQMESFVELYIAYFNRAPDAVGLNFWGSAFANGTTFEEMAALFTDQDETRATYAEDLSNADFTTAVYSNVLGRTADQAGFDFWVDVLDSGARSSDQFILSVLEGAKTPIAGGTADQMAQQAADQRYLSDKTDIGTYYSITRGLSDVADAATTMAIYDGSEESLSQAQIAINAHFVAATDPNNGDFMFQLVGVVDNPFGDTVVI